MLAAFAALAAGLAAYLYRRKKAAHAAPAAIQPPLVNTTLDKQENAAQPGPATAALQAQSAPPTATGTNWIRIEARAVELRRSMMNATLVYRIVLANRSGTALSNVELEADLATAHGRVPVDQQLASPGIALTVRERIGRLAPGERLELRGEIPLPLSEVRIIQQGKALHCVPLLRVRATCETRDPVARTWVVGRKTPESNAAGRLQPFRFDAPPQTYTKIGERALD